MTAPYELIPIGIDGPVHKRATRILGPDLEYSALARENERLRADLDEARREAAGAQRLKERLEAEARLRVIGQARLHSVAAALCRIAEAHPQAAPEVDQARREIWGIRDA